MPAVPYRCPEIANECRERGLDGPAIRDALRVADSAAERFRLGQCSPRQINTVLTLFPEDRREALLDAWVSVYLLHLSNAYPAGYASRTADAVNT